MEQSADCDMSDTEELRDSVSRSSVMLSSLVVSTLGSMDWVISSVFPFTRSSPYSVGGSSIL